jgi:glycerol kinase
MPFILAIDQGTTSTRALVIDEAGQCRGVAQREFTQHFPRPGWVEHDPLEIWQTVRDVVAQALTQAKVNARELAGIGITNQRETVVLWERSSSRPVAAAIVWQDRRTTDFCRAHKGDEPWLNRKTGLVLDPYFSATKLHWLLQTDASLRRRAEAGELACGTVDSWLIWQLSGGQVHATDFSNASRTLLLDIHQARWDDELCDYFGVPRRLLAEVRASAADFGVTRGLDFLPDGIPIGGVAGDQQAVRTRRRAARRRQVHLRHGRVLPGAHRRPGRDLPLRIIDEPGGADWSNVPICARRERVHRRRRRAVAARRRALHREVR